MEDENSLVLQGGKLKLKPNVDHPKHKAKAAEKDLEVALDDVTTNWAGLNANQKQEAIRRLLVIVARILLWQVRNKNR